MAITSYDLMSGCLSSWDIVASFLPTLYCIILICVVSLFIRGTVGLCHYAASLRAASHYPLEAILLRRWRGDFPVLAVVYGLDRI